MDFKVVKEFGSAKKGDILEECDGMFSFDITEGNNNRTMVMDQGTANNLVKKGYLEAVEDDATDEKLNKLEELVDSLIDKYETANKEVAEAYDNKEIPTCVKVEADTVYYNMTKILKKIKETINE